MKYSLQRLPGGFSAGFASLGQPGPVAPFPDSAWTDRAQSATAQYDAYMKRAVAIKDPSVRADILNWVGSSTTPGTPADRYQFVQDDLESGSAWDDPQTQHIKDLEAVNLEFNTRVSNGEQSGTFAPTSPLALMAPGGQLSPTGIGLLIGAAACLVVVPLVVLK